MNLKNIKTITQLKKEILQTASNNNEGHVPSAFSILDILFVLYDEVITKQKLSPQIYDNDVFILSKGHASLAIYSILKHFKIISNLEFQSFCKFNSKLGGHPDRLKVPGIEASTGSLGHGLPIAVGIALTQKLLNTGKKTYVLIGDGESNEGTTWESAMFASTHNLSNLICIVDSNRSSDRAIIMGNICQKFQSFGWDVTEINGHDHSEIQRSLKSERGQNPKLIEAKTIKGYGIKVMENNPEWHHKIPHGDELRDLLGQII